MANIRRDFTAGRMNLDADNRLLPDSEYREATNVVVLNNENNQEGSVRKLLSNKKLTNLDLGENPIYLGGYAQNSRNRVFMRFLSDKGTFLVEHDCTTNTSSFLLHDTRPIGSRVFELDSNFFCTAINIISSEELDQELLLMTDNNLEPLCINIERAKTWGENGFEIEDIYLIKKPPRYAPKATLSYGDIKKNNNLEERFYTFSYRYQYLDNEWSALSSFTNPKFEPKPYEVDYYSLDNLGMVNNLNAVEIEFNTGDKRVLRVQIIAKESNSNALYIIETFNKKTENFANNALETFLFTNDKSYRQLPLKELYRTFDNVPRKALSQTVIENIVVFGNYLEGYDIVDADNNKIKIDYEVSITNTLLSIFITIPKSVTAISGTNNITLNNTIASIKKGSKITFFLEIQKIEGELVYKNNFQFFVEQNFSNLQAVFNSSDFINFIDVINTAFQTNYTYDLAPADNALLPFKDPEITKFTTSANVCGLNVTKVQFKDSANSNAIVDKYLKYNISSQVSYTDVSSASSCKSNRPYEIGIEYLDKFNRKTLPLTIPNNSVFIPHERSNFKNAIQVKIKNKPPAFADRYKIVVKTPALTYYTVVVNNFFIDAGIVWVKLEGTNIDKVKQGDYLILKRTPSTVSSTVVKIKILSIEQKEKNFISIGIPQLKEPSGLYMKIKPRGFAMNFNENVYLEKYNDAAKLSGYPNLALDLFTSDDGITKKSLKPGDFITLRLHSFFYYDSGVSNRLYENQFLVLNNYNNFTEWFTENIANLSMPTTDGTNNYQGKVSIATGDYVEDQFQGNKVSTVNPNPAGKEYLLITGLESGGSNDRYGRMDCTINLRTSEGDYVFETEPKRSIEQDLFFETEQTFDIVNGLHTANNQSQTSTDDAIIDLDFFNCFSQGNGIESYQIKDAFNKPSMNIDTRPTTTSTEEYKSNLRVADLTYSEPYNDSSNYNGLNVFNLSEGNFKDNIDKQFGSIQIIQSRENDIVILQEDKSGIVRFNKEELFSATGETTLTTTKNILGNYNPYQGNRGIGKNPESFSMDDYGRIKYASSRNGTIVRLSLDGIEDINYGLRTYLRSLFIQNPNAKILSGFDPYLDLTVFSFKNNVKTMSHSEGNKGWTSFWRYFPEGMLRLNNFFLTIKNGQLWQHNDVDNPVMNNIYGEQLVSSIKTVFNEAMSDDKIFKTIVTESNEKWKAVLATNLTNGEIKKNEFNTHESRQFAYVRGNEDTTSLRGTAVQGVGNCIEINGLQIKFLMLVDLVSVGDVLFQVSKTTPIEIGIINAIDKENKIFTLNSFVNVPVLNVFCFAKKNSRIEGEEMRGYYLEVDLINDDTANGELFAVNSNAIKSYV